MSVNWLYKSVLHPLEMNSLRHWRRIRAASSDVDSGQRFRAALISLLSPGLAPLRFAEKLLYGKRVAAQEIHEPPIFILGHWRTGTTHLHNLLCRDPNLGYVTTFQTLAPASCLVGLHTLRHLVNFITPRKRHMDNMSISADHPQEEEFALCNLTPHTFYRGWYFPKEMPELFRQYALFDGIAEDELEEWRRVYLGVLKKATIHADGRRLVLKNPVNTARVKALLHLFPDAKFIHIHRNPYVVFKSTQRLLRTTMDITALQTISDQEIEDYVLTFYRDMMTRFLEERALIPEGNLVEVPFEDLEENPMAELARIYEQADLPGWDAARPRMEAYLASLDAYQKNHFTMREADMAKVEKHWQFSLDEWGYNRPPVAEASAGDSRE
jgi:omega-hydroxy-beta-dihydromenaquinone-9 sulfotransferase